MVGVVVGSVIHQRFYVLLLCLFVVDLDQVDFRSRVDQPEVEVRSHEYMFRFDEGITGVVAPGVKQDLFELVSFSIEQGSEALRSNRTVEDH